MRSQAWGWAKTNTITSVSAARWKSAFQGPTWNTASDTKNKISPLPDFPNDATEEFMWSSFKWESQSFICWSATLNLLVFEAQLSFFYITYLFFRYISQLCEEPLYQCPRMTVSLWSQFIMVMSDIGRRGSACSLLSSHIRWCSAGGLLTDSDVQVWVNVEVGNHRGSFQCWPICWGCSATGLRL